MNKEEKKQIKDFEYWVNFNNEKGVCSIPDYICNRVLNIIEKQQKEIEELQIIADDIKGHNIVYTDTPEFEEKFISKDKIKAKIEETNKEIEQMEQDDIGVGFTLGNIWSDLKAKVNGWEELLQEGEDK